MRSKVLTALLTVAVVLMATPAAAQTPTPTPPDAQSATATKTGQQALVFAGKLANGRTAKLNYLLFLPSSYNQDPNHKWPMLVFLHGSREAGRDVNRVKRAIVPQLVEDNPDFPFIVVSPQSPSQVNGWYPSLGAIESLLNQLQTELTVDTNRIYLTGLSMGGYGAWALAMDDPNRFAAIAPVVGGYFFNPKQLCKIKDKPIWIFGAKKDRNVPLKESERVVKALKDCGGDPKFTIFENANHDEGWELAYTTTDIFEWLLQQKRTVVAASAS